MVSKTPRLRLEKTAQIKETPGSPPPGKWGAPARSLYLRLEKTIKSMYVPNRSEIHYAHTVNNIRCYTTHPRVGHNIKKTTLLAIC